MVSRTLSLAGGTGRGRKERVPWQSSPQQTDKGSDPSSALYLLRVWGKVGPPLEPRFCLLQKGDRPILTGLLMKEMGRNDMRVPVWHRLKLFPREGRAVP